MIKRKVQSAKRKVETQSLKLLVLSFSFALYAFSFASLACCRNEKLYTDKRVMMGTFVEVMSPSKKAAGIVFEEFARLENLLSKYRPDSEISRLNLRGSLKVSTETFYILKKSKEFWEASNGAFDISVGVLVDLWGFTDKKYSRPSEEKIKQVLKLVGEDKIILQDNDNVVKFMFSGMKIDLGAIAKGYALDCAVKNLKENNIKSCLINAGGQIYCLGEKFGKPWKIAINNPRRTEFVGNLELKDKSVATSGDDQQYFIIGNKRYAHILDPKTGCPADTGIASVTVVANDGLTADALATAIFVLGEEKGKALADKFSGTEVKIITIKQ